MAVISMSSLPKAGRGAWNRRRTRNSIFDEDLEVVPRVTRVRESRQGIIHSVALFGDFGTAWWCRRHDHDLPWPDKDEPLYPTDHPQITCVQCVLCKGCPACKDNYITELSLQMGKWESQDGRRLYPFEMDNMHLKNTIAKLYREKEKFKKHWRQWLDVLEPEAAARCLSA